MFFVHEIDSSRMLENLVQLRIKQNTDSLTAPLMAMLQLVANTAVECAATLASLAETE
jgi:hypothetical protein